MKGSIALRYKEECIMTTVRKYRIYNIFQYDQEADFLSEMHRQGLAFKEYSPPFTYVFEKTEPLDMTYQLIYKRENQDKDTFIQMMADYGFEYKGEQIDYYYFCQPTKEMRQDFFTDQESQVDQMKQILKNRLLPILIIVFILGVLNINETSLDITGMIFEGVTTIINFVFGLYAIVIIWVVYHYVRLKNRIENGELDGR